MATVSTMALLHVAVCFGAKSPAETVPFTSSYYDPVQKLIDDGILIGAKNT